MTVAHGEGQRQHNLFPSAPRSSPSFTQNECPSSTLSLVLESSILSNAKDALLLVVSEAVPH